MNQRARLKEFIFANFYTKPLVSFGGGYCTYLFFDEFKGFSAEHLTTGLINTFAIPQKYYETPQEMYDDINQYFTVSV